MEAFFRTHEYLVRHVKSPVRRLLMDEIDWSKRLIGIKGSRGVGKTTFLLQYAKEHFDPADRSCLYVNFNNFYFTTHTLKEFAGDFYKNGGRTLLLDQTFKYEEWSNELRYCYDNYPELHIVFSGSSVMRLKEDNPDLYDVVDSYNLRGFSFREFLNLKTNNSFPAYSLEQITENHQQIAINICKNINPLDYFSDYLHHGFYPFFLETSNYSENLLKTINMILEVDILIIKQIDLKYLSKIRKLLYLIMQCAPCTLNVSQLSTDIETSRSTVMNYIKYLQDARLLNLLYYAGDKYPKKPQAAFMQNTNLMHIVTPGEVSQECERKTFLYNSLHARHKINMGKNHTDFLIDETLSIKYIKNEKVNHKPIPNVIYGVDNIKSGSKNNIPVWLFGFLY
ncbi:MAG TPA: AAA family ATPase [Paludibacteraceae bacterium]|nr:AAA family ATPase [Paludibacteraceae bacterium]